MSLKQGRSVRHSSFNRNKFNQNKISNKRPDCTEAPAEGPIKIFFDDEREMPEGFVVARTLPALEQLLDSIDLTRLHTICFDWHLGSNAEPDQNGHDAVKMLLDRIEEDSTRFSGLSSIWLHSTNRDEAIKMARSIEQSLHKPETRDYFEDVYVIVDNYSPNVGI